MGAECDFRQPTTLTHFTRLHTLSAQFAMIRNFHPGVLPSTLCSITLELGPPEQSQDVEDPPDLDLSLVLPAGGQASMDMECDRMVIQWNHSLPL